MNGRRNKGGGPLSAKTVRLVHVVLHKALAIDFDNARLSVTQNVTAPNYQVSVSDVKSAHSLRTIDINHRTISVLKSWRRQQLERQMESGVRADESGFLFAKPSCAAPPRLLLAELRTARRQDGPTPDPTA
jgi:hypothetical protein